MDYPNFRLNKVIKKIYHLINLVKKKHSNKPLKIMEKLNKNMFFT